MKNKKTSKITLSNVHQEDGWYELANELGIPEDKVSTVFQYGEYASITIEVDEDLNIVGGKINKFKTI